ncbi:MAG TPA: hypothetical protein VIS99_15430 [Terrimicrobiaceae bacterium]
MKIQVFATIGALSMAACSTSHMVINAQSDRPIPARSNYVVMAAQEMQDLDTADRLVLLTEEALRVRGYRSDIAKDADVVVVTQAACIAPSGKEIAIEPAGAVARSTPPKHPEDAFASVAALAIGSTERVGWSGLDGLQISERPSESSERLRVTVKAASMKDWMKPEMTFEDLPAIWMVAVEGRAPASQRTEFLEQAIDAASTYFAQNTEKPRTRVISFNSSRHHDPVAVAAHNEPDLNLDPLP